MAEWMKTAELIPIGSFRQVKEDGSDIGSSESDSENSDHGETWEDKDAYTPNMIGPDGKTISGPVVLTPEQVTTQRAQRTVSQSSSGRERCQDTAADPGKTDTRVARVHPSKT
jgi:hypothetical protein